MKKRFCLIVLATLLSGCITHTTEVKTPAFDQQLPKPQADYSSGSIWQASSISLTEDPKARRRGDVVTILISENASASKEAKTDTKRSTAVNAGIPNFLGMEQLGFLKNSVDLSKLVNASVDSTYGGAGSTSRQERLNATVTAKVIDVLPNGNLLIEGRRNVKVNNEDQIIIIEGTVRPADIGPDNIVNSIFIADAKISYAGKGIISDRQSPGWLMNIVDKLWPF
ncbi:flagellar basal body L-ring protein FlgH [Pelotalea chapellei]|uniref:Flagellar L-ring protein n=1 Tax=Pelotalea chapellei TaxID=44671 RepID=A0ABS5U8C5_9BACT|nr:flagellar basal body L-ring protein FlgH [Pelotalea chapellei]MBT1071927.1 flagellar basal body L-ring protein FlgH [Pelotalea chapellei]